MTVDLEFYRAAILRGEIPNIPPHVIEDVFAGLAEGAVQAYLARRRHAAH